MCCLPGASKGRHRFEHAHPDRSRTYAEVLLPQKAASVYKRLTMWRSHWRAESWSWTSTVPTLWWTACRIFWPWNPLPRPSKRATMTPCKPTSTESQPRENWSLTAWPPGALSLLKPGGKNTLDSQAQFVWHLKIWIRNKRFHTRSVQVDRHWFHPNLMG